jgi:hypothetical protein
MNPEMPKDLQRWEETRKKGKWPFVLLNGMLAWGLPMFAVMTFVVNRKADRPLSPGLIAISAVVWALGGCCFGLAVWTMSERKYQKYLRESQNEK